MLQRGSKVEIIDNSGAKEGKCICILDGFFNKKATTGSLMIISIRKLRLIRKVKVGQIFLALVVKTRFPNKALDNVYTQFNKNCVILLSKKKQIFGTKIFGTLSRNLRKKKYLRVLLVSGSSFF